MRCGGRRRPAPRSRPAPHARRSPRRRPRRDPARASPSSRGSDAPPASRGRPARDPSSRACAGRASDALLDLQRPGERGRHRHLLVEREPDEERHRLLGEQRVRLVVSREVQAVVTATTCILERFGELLRDRGRAQVRVRARDRRHDRRVRHDEVLVAVAPVRARRRPCRSHTCRWGGRSPVLSRARAPPPSRPRPDAIRVRRSARPAPSVPARAVARSPRRARRRRPRRRGNRGRCAAVSRGSSDVSVTRPRDFGFIANTAPLTS